MCCKEASFTLNSSEMLLTKCFRSHGFHGEYDRSLWDNINKLHLGHRAEYSAQLLPFALCCHLSLYRWHRHPLRSSNPTLESPHVGIPHPQFPASPVGLTCKLSISTTTSPGQASISSHQDHCNNLFASSPAVTLAFLQSVIQQASRVS